MKVTATLMQPGQFSTLASSDQLARTERLIPGWVVRGAFAAAWLSRHAVREPSGRFAFARDSDRDDFAAAFERDVQFGPLFAGEPPLPLSVAGHKYEAGDPSHRIDLAHRTNPELPETCPHPRCSQRVEGKRGLVDTASDKPPVRTRTSVAIGPDSTAVKGMLFSRESVESQSVLSGYIHGPDASIDRLAELPRLRLGGRRTTQGDASVETDKGCGTHVEPEFTEDGRLVLRLISPAILVDGHGRSVAKPTDASVSELLDADVQVSHSWARWERIGGWHVASGLPKNTELAVTAGSTFLVQSRDGHAITVASATALLRRGLGLRRHEGFGHLRLTPFQLPHVPDEDRLSAHVGNDSSLALAAEASA
jgi:CRISPR-associated protein Csx10